MNPPEEKVFRPYSSEELLEALKYISENRITNFEFRGVNELLSTTGIMVKRVIKPRLYPSNYKSDLSFVIYYVSVDGIEKSHSNWTLVEIERIILISSKNVFEGWFPGWDSWVKPVHEKNM